MTDGCGRPYIMHGPHHRLPAFKDSADTLQRQHTLIDPMQMDDISLLKLTGLGDICTCIGYIDIKQMLSAEVETPEHTPAFPKERPPEAPLLRQGRHADLVGLLVTYQHHGLRTIVLQCLHQTVGSQCGSSGLLTRIHNQYSHNGDKVTDKRVKNQIYLGFSERE